MDEDENPELLGLGPERMKLRVGELVVGDARADGGAAEPELLHAVDELLHRQVRELEGHRREGDEAVRVPRAELGEPLVLDLDHPGDDVALGAVPRGVDAERLHVDTLRVHLADASLADLADPGPAMVVDLAPQERVRLRDHAVRVHVDGLRSATAHHHRAAPAARHRRESPRGRLRAALCPCGRPRLGSDPGLGGRDHVTRREGDGRRRTGDVAPERSLGRHRVSLGPASIRSTKRSRRPSGWRRRTPASARARTDAASGDRQRC